MCLLRAKIWLEKRGKNMKKIILSLPVLTLLTGLNLGGCYNDTTPQQNPNQQSNSGNQNPNPNPNGGNQNGNGGTQNPNGGNTNGNGGNQNGNSNRDANGNPIDCNGCISPYEARRDNLSVITANNRCRAARCGIVQHAYDVKTAFTNAAYASWQMNNSEYYHINPPTMATLTAQVNGQTVYPCLRPSDLDAGEAAAYALMEQQHPSR